MYAVLDIETTGGKYNEEGITEIAIHRFDGETVVDQFISLVNPERGIQPYVAKLTGITEMMVRTAPKFHEVAKRVVEITENSVLVAHNAQFDYRILRTEFRRLGYDFERNTLCTIDLAKTLLPEAESYNLGKLAKSLGLPMSNRHRANGDALATLDLFKVLLNKDSGKSVLGELIRDGLNGILGQRHVDMLRDVPSETGVYYFHNKLGQIIFVDASKNMLKRINTHFTGDSELSLTLRKETREVRFERTGSYLIARLKAMEEEDRIAPVYTNVRLNGRQDLKKARTNLQEWKGKTAAVIVPGRKEGEKGVILIKNGQYKGYGFVGLNHQINNIHILESVITPVKGEAHHLYLIASDLVQKDRPQIVELNGKA